MLVGSVNDLYLYAACLLGITLPFFVEMQPASLADLLLTGLVKGKLKTCRAASASRRHVLQIDAVVAQLRLESAHVKLRHIHSGFERKRRTGPHALPHDHAMRLQPH